jgi:hypothetical protein
MLTSAGRTSSHLRVFNPQSVTGPVSIAFIGFFVSDWAYCHHSTVIGFGRETSPNSTGGRT